MSREIINIKDNDQGQRLDKFMMKCYKNLSSSMLYKAIRKKDIRLNGKRCSGNEILSSGDELRIFLPDDIIASAKSLSKPVISKNPLDIVYEDENIIIIYKPKGLDSQSGGGNSKDSVISRLYNYIQYDPEKEHSFSPSLCNRLDRNTDGLVIAAKNAKALREVNECIRDNKTKKEYLAVLYGTPKEKHFIYECFHRLSQNNTVEISKDFKNDYKKTITEYTVLKEHNNFCLVRINLITGRKHQIRAVSAFLGYPVLGDNKYGNKTVNKKYKLKSQVLTAYKISFMPNKEMSVYSDLNNKSFEIPKEKLGIYQVFDNI